MDLEAQITGLEALSSAELGERWRKMVGSPAPKVGPKMMRLALAWEIQAAALGGVPRGTTAALDQLERGLTKTVPPTAGMRLVREWGGRVHVVTVGERGGGGDAGDGGDHPAIRWDGREWRSLSEVARAITGTRWSGPAFFGLKKKVAA